MIQLTHPKRLSWQPPFFSTALRISAKSTGRVGRASVVIDFIQVGAIFALVLCQSRPWFWALHLLELSGRFLDGLKLWRDSDWLAVTFLAANRTRSLHQLGHAFAFDEGHPNLHAFAIHLNYVLFATNTLWTAQGALALGSPRALKLVTATFRLAQRSQSVVILQARPFIRQCLIGLQNPFELFLLAGFSVWMPDQSKFPVGFLNCSLISIGRYTEFLVVGEFRQGMSLGPFRAKPICHTTEQQGKDHFTWKELLLVDRGKTKKTQFSSRPNNSNNQSWADICMYVCMYIYIYMVLPSDETNAERQRATCYEQLESHWMLQWCKGIPVKLSSSIRGSQKCTLQAFWHAQRPRNQCSNPTNPFTCCYTSG